MRIYLAGEREGAGGKLREGQDRPAWLVHVKRRLFSYFYHGMSKGNVPDHDVIATAALGIDLFLDSGAFTAFTKNATIAPERYADYIKFNSGIWTCRSSLDAIGQGEEAAAASYANFQTLTRLGVDVCPVFHVREPDRWLAKYVADGHPYIFIGGMVPETTTWLRERLDGLWGDILCHKDGSARVKVHGFGLTDQKLMFRYPWFSVDSSSWLMKGVFGSCALRKPDGKLITVFFSPDRVNEARRHSSWHYSCLPPALQKQVDDWLAPYGVNGEDCAKSYKQRDAVNAAVFQGLEDMGTEVFKGRQFGLFG